MKYTFSARRVLALVMSAVMLLGMLPAAAMAQEDWQMLSITLSWMDVNGNQGMAVAEPVQWSQDQSFWATVDAGAPLEALTISIYHPAHAYTFDPADGAQLVGVVDSGAEMNMDAMIPITAFEGDQFADAFNLYVSTQMIPMMPEDSFEEPSMPAQTEVWVEYVDLNGNPLRNGETVIAIEGEANMLTAPAIDGYTALEPASVSVSVDSNGIANPASVIFYYEQNYVAPAQAEVWVEYVDLNGNPLRNGETVIAIEGEANMLTAPAIDGYTALEPVSVSVSVDSNGIANPGSVIFYYEQNYVAPAQAEVQVEYVDLNGNPLRNGETVVAIEGEANMLTAPAIDGYTALEPTSVSVSVDSNGVANPGSVIFYYEQNYVAPAQAEVQVEYVDLNGNPLRNGETVVAIEGEANMLTAPAIDGYTALEPVSVSVSVDSNGIANPGSVIFYYEQNYVEPSAPAQATVTVLHQNESGVTLQETTLVCIAGERNVASPIVIDGYTVIDGTEIEITVADDGTPSVNPVVFFYAANPVEEPEEPEVPEEPVQPVKATVVIRYVDEATGEEIAPGQTRELEDGAHMITAEPAGLPEGYVPVTEPNVAVDVAQGAADPAEVIFVYRLVAEEPEAPVQPEEPIYATVNVYYRDESGANIIDPRPVMLPAGQSTVVVPEEGVLPAHYVPVNAGAVSVNVDVNGLADTDAVVFTYRMVAPETPIPAGEMINRFGTTNTNQLQYREGPSTGHKALGKLAKGSAVWMIQEIVNDNNVKWTRVLINGTEAYIMSKYLDVMTQAESDAYESANLATPVPDFEKPGDEIVQTPEVPEVPEITDPPAVTNPPVNTDDAVEAAVIERFGRINDAQVKYREGPATSYKALGALKKGTVVWMVEEIVNEKNVKWTRVLIDGTEAYVMSKFLNVMTQEESDAYADANLATPVPEAGGQTGGGAAPVVTEPPAIEPPVTEEPAPEQPEQPGYPEDDGFTNEPAYHIGYVLTTRATALRTEVSHEAHTVITTLPQETLLQAMGHTITPEGEVWSLCVSLDNYQGYVLQDDLLPLTDPEAQYYIAKWEAGQPTSVPTNAPTPEPPVQQGYAYTVGDGVYFRSMPSTMSDIKNVLARNIVVYVENQQYVDGVAWHIVRFDNEWGYIRADMLRMMTAQEEINYLNSQQTAPPAVQSTPQPFDENALSSYGYVSAKTVNFRKGASTSAGKIMTLKQYAFCLILGTEVMDGDVWYRVNYNGTEGYLHSNYFKQMTVAEFEEFYGSEEYLQGVKNNSPAGTTMAPGTGDISGIISPEDQTVNIWTDPNNRLDIEYATFAPMATVEPIATPETTIPLEPVATATIAPLPSPQQTHEVIYPQEETESGSAMGWIIGVLIAVVLIGGGIYGYAIYARGKKRAAQQRAAARRAAAAQQRPVGPDGRPYARPAQQPRTAYPQQPQQPRTAYSQQPQQPRPAYQQPQQPTRPAYTQQPAQAHAPQQNPYARPVAPQDPANNPYRRPESAQPVQQPRSYTASYRPAEDDAPSFTASYRRDDAAPMPRRRRQQSAHLSDSDDTES